MNWEGPADFFAMGGHGLYVWGSYAVFACVAAVEPWLAGRRRRLALSPASGSPADGVGSSEP